MYPKLKEYKKRWGIISESTIKLGLHAMEFALSALENPEKKLNFIHIAGTNGKGSTLTFMQSILKEHGLKTAAFVSPAIYDIHDQIQLNGESISSHDLNNAFRKIAEANLSGKLTDFELLTVAAILAFEEYQPDIVLIECGLGGRFDSTNVIKPIVSVIPSISLEHTAFLGTTLKEIAWHKGGIIKSEVPVITGQLPNEAAIEISHIAEELKSLLLSFGDHFSIQKNVDQSENYAFEDIIVEKLERKMLGDHQGKNMACAITAITEVFRQFNWELDVEKVRKAVQKAKILGRFEEVAPNVFLDGAHNPASARELANTIEQQFEGEKVDFIIGMLKDKDIDGVLKELEVVAKSFSFIDFEHDRAESAEKLFERCELIEKYIINKKEVTLDLLSKKNSVTIITGSLYLLTYIRAKFHNKS